MKKIFIAFFTAFLFLLVGCDKENNEKTGAQINNYSMVLERVNNTLAEKEKQSKAMVSGFSDSYVEITDDNSIKAARCYVYYLELLYKNEKFPVTDNPVRFIGNYVFNGKTIQYNDMTMLAKTEDNIISFDVIGVSYYTRDSNIKNEFYMNMVIDFNFDKDELNSFNLNICETNSKKELTGIWLSQKFDGNNLYEFKDYGVKEQELVSYLDINYWTSFKKLLPNTVIVNTDFSAEYTKATDVVMGKGYFL